MRHAEIESGRFYEVALDRSGRGGSHIHERDVVKIARVDRDDFYMWSTQYVVTGYRALLKGVVRIRCATRDVLRPATDEEVERYERHFATSRRYGWIDEEAEDKAVTT